MKKLILLLLITTLIACEDESVTISQDEYDILRGVKPPKKILIVGKTTYEILTGSDGHEYYEMFIGTGGYDGKDRHFHYIDCIKCKRDSL